jgi:hypothetical protein
MEEAQSFTVMCADAGSDFGFVTYLPVFAKPKDRLVEMALV